MLIRTLSRVSYCFSLLTPRLLLSLSLLNIGLCFVFVNRIMAASQQPSDVLEYTCHTCAVTVLWGGRLLERHLSHTTVRIACNGYNQSFTDRVSAQRHFDQHQFPNLGYRAPIPCRRLSADDVPLLRTILRSTHL